MARRQRWRGALQTMLLLVVPFFSCGATCQGKTFAPPVRMGTAGLGGVYEAGGGEVRGTIGIANTGGGIFGESFTRLVADGQLLIALARWVELEAALGGVDVTNRYDPNEKAQRGWGVLMFGAGVRVHPPWTGVGRVALSLGGGVGCGGARGGEELLLGGCGSPTIGNVAGGGYIGLDLGAQFFRVFGVYFNNRYQVATARAVPTTQWGQHLLGLQFGHDLVLNVEGGVAHFANDEHRLTGGMATVSLAWRWRQLAFRGR